MATSIPSNGRRSSRTATGSASSRWLYRVAMCVFPEAGSARDGLRQISVYGTNPSDMAVILPSDLEAAAFLSGTGCPSLFIYGRTRSEPEWRNLGLPASYTARRLADVSAWASERTALAVRRDLSTGCVVLLVYGLRSALQALMADVLLHVAALRVELHDIPPGDLSG